MVLLRYVEHIVRLQLDEIRTCHGRDVVNTLTSLVCGDGIVRADVVSWCVAPENHTAARCICGEVGNVMCVRGDEDITRLLSDEITPRRGETTFVCGWLTLCALGTRIMRGRNPCAQARSSNDVVTLDQIWTCCGETSIV